MTTHATPGEPGPGELSYNAAIDEVERILSELESSVVDVDHLAERVKRAGDLLSYCRAKLASVQTDVERMVRDIESAEPVADE